MRVSVFWCVLVCFVFGGGGESGKVAAAAAAAASTAGGEFLELPQKVSVSLCGCEREERSRGGICCCCPFCRGPVTGVNTSVNRGGGRGEKATR